MNQTWENGKKTKFWVWFWPIWPNLPLPQFFCGFYLYTMLDIVASYQCMQFQGKCMIQTQENCIKPYFGPDLDQLAPNLGLSRIFFKNLAALVTRYHGQLSSCKILEKTNYPILKKLSDGRTDGRTDKTDQQELFHRTLSDWCRAFKTTW